VTLSANPPKTVLAKVKTFNTIGHGQEEPLKKVAGCGFYNAAPWTTSTLLNDDKNLAGNLARYIRVSRPGRLPGHGRVRRRRQDRPQMSHIGWWTNGAPDQLSERNCREVPVLGRCGTRWRDARLRSWAGWMSRAKITDRSGRLLLYPRL
jgi:hypothetical protein